jgi:hypothetical protein
MYRLDQYFGEKLPGNPMISTLIMVLDRLINSNCSQDHHGTWGIIIEWIDQEIQKKSSALEVTQ